MKKIMKSNIGLFSACCLLFFGGCTDLSETAYTSIVSDQFEAVEADLLAMVAAAYTPLRNVMTWYGHFDVQEECSDELMTPSRPTGWYDGGTYVRNHQHAWQTNQGSQNTTYGDYIGVVNKVNLAISQFNKEAMPAVNEALFPAYIIELRAVRAFAYAILLDSHGNVPIVESFGSTELPTQATRRELYDFVVKELTEVINSGLLSEDPVASFGRMTKWAAYACLARVYLNAGVYHGTYDEIARVEPVFTVTKWQECINACDLIINSGLFELEANYFDIFKEQNRSSREIVFGIPYDEVYATQWSNHQKTLCSEHQSAWSMLSACWGGGATGIPQFIDTYDLDDDRLYVTWLQGPIRKNKAETGPVLFTYTRGISRLMAADGPPTNDGKTAGNYEGFRVGKFEIKVGARALSNTFPFFRYADILMMKAECMMRTGNADGAAAIVSQIRERAFRNSDPSKATVTGADLLADSKYRWGTIKQDDGMSFADYLAYMDAGNQITGTVIDDPGNLEPVKYGGFYDELGWEFALEARRRTDMIRFGTYTTKSWFHHKPNTDMYDGGAKNALLFPIPRSVVQANKEFKQNPGYRD